MPEQEEKRRCALPCYTLVQVEVKSKEMAEQALKQMGVEADISRNSNGTYTVTPKSQSANFRDKFLQEYSASLSTKNAKAAGYYVSRQEVNGEIELTLRQY